MALKAQERKVDKPSNIISYSHLQKLIPKCRRGFIGSSTCPILHVVLIDNRGLWDPHKHVRWYYRYDG